MEPVLSVLLYSAAAVAVSPLGVVPLRRRTRPPASWLGWANAAAAGVMLAAAFILAEQGAPLSPLAFGAAALGGIAFVAWSHAFSGTGELDLNRLEETSPVYGYEVLLVSSLHAGAEGVAIGAAMLSEPTLGLFVAVVMALHNVPEATLLAAVYRSRGVSLGRAATLAAISNGGQVLLAVSSYAVLEALPGALPLGLGFASGALVYLVMVDLLPESYRQAGSTSIAWGTILSMIVFALVHGWLRG